MKNEIQEVLKNTVSKSLYDNNNQDFLILQRQAQKFLTNIRNYSNIFEESKKKDSLKKGLTKIYDSMKKDTELTQNLIIEAHHFENAVNTFLQRTMYLTYVKDDGTLLFLDETHTGELYRQATANAGRGNISKEKITDINDLIQELNKKIQKSVARNKPIYTSAVYRWNKTNWGPKKHFYYKEDGKWKPSKRVRTRGRIAEAYVQLVIDENKTTDKELGLKLLDERIEIDNIPAVVKGDVVYDAMGNIHLAVKEGSFSTAKIGSYYNLAINILSIKRPPSKEDFQKALPKLVRLSATADKIIEEMNKEIEEAFKEIVEEIASKT